MSKFTNNLSAIDLFSGAGGLSVGLKRAGFKVLAGLEIDQEIAKTFEFNHPGSVCIAKDIREIDGRELMKRLSVKKIDLIAGCPPCQGFSKLTDKYHRDDERNDLVLEMARLVTEIKPRICMLENVPGLATRGAPLFKKFIEKIEAAGYVTSWGVLQMADYGVPQSRRRLVLLAGLGFKIELPTQTHTERPAKGSAFMPWTKVREVLNMPTPKTLSQSRSLGGPQALNWHVTRDLDPITIERLRNIRPGQSRLKLPKDLRPKCHVDGAGFANAYGRMRWGEIAPTMTSRCTTLSSGRFGHPQANRTISVREAARIQTFPDEFQFITDKIELVCKMIGNALPSRFAEAVSRSCYDAIRTQS